MDMRIPGDIIERAYQGETTREDALMLFGADPFELFKLADTLRVEAVGDVVTYVVNRNIYITNGCLGNCGFCAFKSDEGYRLSLEDILERVEEADRAGAAEICIQGGYLPNLYLEDYLEILEAIKSHFPKMSIHGYSPMEIHHASTLCDISLEEALLQLKKSGLDTLTGTSAEILSDRVRKIICHNKINTQQWIDTIKTAHNVGVRTNATMMYGHVETIEERIDHILTIRDIQKETGGFTEFVPMPFMPYNNAIGEEMLNSERFMTTGMEDMKTFAISRIILNKHIDNIQSSWVKLGKKQSQVALFCGTNDLGGTLMEDQITTASGGSNGEYVEAQEIEWMVRKAGRTPKQRNALYEEV